MNTGKLLVLILIGFFSLGGCAKIPQESVELSIALGDQIASLEQAHLALLDSFFAAKEQQIDRFMEEQWAPEFNHNFFNAPQIKSKWQEVVTSQNPVDRDNFLQWVGMVIQQKLQEKRQQLLTPLAET